MSSEALAKEDWSFGGLRRNIGATGSCPWGSTYYAVEKGYKVQSPVTHETPKKRQEKE